MAEHVLVTGGTGSFGSVFVERVLPFVDSVTVYSRDEFKQSQMAERIDSDRLRFVVGDIRDRDQLRHAFEGVTTIIHAAAMKQVPTCEANPTEAIDTNIEGSRNVAVVALERGCNVVALSTDKAAIPTNVYGATKLISDRLFLSAGFVVVRCGNIFGSRGSVVPLFERQRDFGSVTVTDKRMTRYSISVKQAVALVSEAATHGKPGEMWVPKMPSYLITDVAQAIAPGCEVCEIGIRAGERLHECLITESEAPDARDCGSHYIIAAGKGSGRVSALYSDENDTWLTIPEIRAQAGYGGLSTWVLTSGEMG